MKAERLAASEDCLKGTKEQMQTAIKVFKAAIDDIENLVNTWAEEHHVRILNTSLCYDEPKSYGMVFVIVVYERIATH